MTRTEADAKLGLEFGSRLPFVLKLELTLKLKPKLKLNLKPKPKPKA